MRILSAITIIVLCALATTFFPGAAPVASTRNGVQSVCPDPSASCRHPLKTFAPYELPFRLPQKIKPNTAYQSEPFFGVVLKVFKLTAVDECDRGEYSSRLEAERRRVQALLPQKKVFAAPQCPNMEAVSYIIGGKANTTRFLAIYGGRTAQEAQQVLARLKKKYPGAVVKRMQVVFEQIVQ
ncbi:MAG TPA: hypothetical protein VF600_07280 [Abditibacteriaceae bacterium]|jgi:hypothetical protein